MSDKLIKIAKFNTDCNKMLGSDLPDFYIYRSKGLLAHLIKRKHFVATKYIDYLPEIITHPDYVGLYNNNIELVKIFKDCIYISVKLDTKNNRYYVATMFETKQGKIDAYIKNGRLKKYE